MSKPNTPIALTIAGSDSGGGAGIQADLKAFSALGVYGCSAITSLTAQNTRGVQSVLPIDPEFVKAQMRSVLSDLRVGAIKTGMLAQAPIIQALVDVLNEFPKIPLVVDPVMVATSGDRLLANDAIDVLICNLIPKADLLTPNLHEAAALLSEPIATTQDAMIAQGKRLLAMGCGAVLMKGGHSEQGDATDILIQPERITPFSAERVNTKNTHGTGCTLASAITAGLAKGLMLVDAVQEAKTYLQGALLSADNLTIGQGCGPVHHFYKFY